MGLDPKTPVFQFGPFLIPAVLEMGQVLVLEP